MKSFLTALAIVIVILIVGNYFYADYNTCPVKCSNNSICKEEIKCGVLKDWFGLDIKFFGKFM